MTADVLVLSGPQTLPRVNLLPPEIQLARKARQVKFGLAGIVVAAAGVVGLLTMSAHHSVSHAKSQLQSAQSQYSLLQGRVQALSDVTTLRAQVAAAQTMLTNAMGSEILWSHYLNDLSLRIPDNVWLTSMSVQMTSSGAGAPNAPAASSSVVPNGVGQISFQGYGFSHDDVATWLESLAKEKCYANPYFTNSTETMLGTKRAVTFTSTVTVTPACYSGRYSQGS